MQGLARHLSFCTVRKALAESAEQDNAAAAPTNTLSADSAETPPSVADLGSTANFAPAEPSEPADNVFESVPECVPTGSEVVDANVSIKGCSHTFISNYILVLFVEKSVRRKVLATT